MVTVSMAASATYIPGASLADKLRLAASKGQIDKIRELLSSGANFEPDRVGSSLNISVIVNMWDTCISNLLLNFLFQAVSPNLQL